MAKLSEKFKLTLDECRMLVLGTQVLISLQFELAYQSGFESAPPIARHLVPVGLGLLLCTFALLLWGPAYHRIAMDGQISNDAQSFMTWATCVALWPLSAAMGVDAFIVSDALCGQSAAIGLGAAAFVFCCVAWYGFALLARRDRPPEVIQAMKDRDKQDEGKGKLHERVNQVLTEARVVLPGAQAMLGFQFVTFFEKAFERLPEHVKFVHLACAGLIGLTVVLLMIPAAFHRLAEAGEESDRLVKVASRCVVAAMLPLAMGISGDFFVVTMTIARSEPLAIALAGIAFAGFVALWFGYTLYRRQQRHAPAAASHPALATSH
jgi:hypothetical protein